MMNRFKHVLPSRTAPSQQRGAVLLVALIFLILLTLLALSSSGSSLLQEKMVSAVRNKQLAEFGAETALREAEARLWMASQTGDPLIRNCSGSGNLKDSSGTAVLQACRAFNRDNPDPQFETFKLAAKLDLDDATVKANSFEYKGKVLTAGTLGNAQLAEQPRYIIEYMGIVSPGGSPTEYKNKQEPGDQDVSMFRITARSVGANKNVTRVVQSTFGALGHD